MVVPTVWRYEAGNILGRKQPHMAPKRMQILLDDEFEGVHIHGAHCQDIQNHMRCETDDILLFYNSRQRIAGLDGKEDYITADYTKKAKCVDR